MRQSGHRQLIYDIVMGSSDHPSAEMIHRRAQAVEPKISLGTVYRNLNSLVEDGKIRKVAVSGEKDRFDKTLGVHSHFYCNCCGRVSDFGDFSGDIERMENEYGCRVNGCDILITGICSECLEVQTNVS